MKALLPFLLLPMAIFCLEACKKQPIPPPAPEFYRININVGQEVPNDFKVDMTLQEIHGISVIEHIGRIERRGGFSISFPKFSYEIDLDEDVSLCRLPPDDDWILNANYIDKTFLRHSLAYDLFCDMRSINRAPACKFVELEMNSCYNGLYQLVEKLDKSTLEINDEDSNAVIFKEPPLFRVNLDEYFPQYPDNFYQQTFPDKEDLDMTPFIEGVRAFILYTSDGVFNEQVSQVFDIGNIIDWHLLLLLSNNGDGILKNFYLYKIDSSTPLRVAPWDYDHSFGRDGDNELNLIRPIEPEKSILLRRLLEMDWYKSALKKRWGELNAGGLFTPKGLKERICIYRITLDRLVGKNFAKWPVNGPWYYDNNNYEAEIDVIFQFIDMRHGQLIDYFENL